LPQNREIYIEMAEAAGLMLIDSRKRNPLVTTTFGVGEMVMAAMKYQPDRLVIGIGGSATNDGGAGFLQALGLYLTDPDGVEIPHGGKHLASVTAVGNTAALGMFRNVGITVLSDVRNPLLGKNGATYTFGTQKGGTRKQLEQLEQGMTRYADVLESAFCRQYRSLPGSGAAGGLGFALRFLPDVRIVPGIRYISDISGIENDIRDADAVFVGEGSLDSQSLQGKVPVGIAEIAKKYNVKVIAFVGKLQCSREELRTCGIDDVHVISGQYENLEQQLRDGPQNIEKAAEKVARQLSAHNPK
jgi:glycerate kinase